MKAFGAPPQAATLNAEQKQEPLGKVRGRRVALLVSGWTDLKQEPNRGSKN